MGAVAAAFTRSNTKRPQLEAVGAEHAIATSEQELIGEVQKVTPGTGARIVFHPVGGPAVAKLTGAMSASGILFQYGALRP